MSWIQIDNKTRHTEAVLQAFFDEPDGDRAAGMPSWLREMLSWSSVDRGELDTALNFRLRWDAVRKNPRANEAAVIELKYGVKYEPLVVAQTLCTAFWLERLNKYESVKAAAVGSYNLMTRSAIQRLRDKGLAAEELRYAEVEICEFGDGLLFFFDAPFSSAWESKEPPDEIVEQYKRSHWYCVEDSHSWYGFDEQQPDQRPLFFSGAWTQVSTLPGGYLGWTGSTTDVGETHIWRD